MTSCERVDRPGEVDERGGGVVADHLVIRSAERLDERALLGEGPGGARAQAVLRRHVHGEQLAARRPRGDARAAAQQRLALGSAGEGHDHALARLPRPLDAVLRAVALQSGVDLVGQPQQGELAQCREVAEAEVVRQGRVDALGGVHGARGQAIAQRLGCEVDDLDLVGRAHHGIRDRLALHDARDLLDDVVEGGDVLHVDGRDDVDARREQLLDVDPALVVARAGRIGVRELVDEGDLRMPFEHGIQVHLVQRDPAVGDGSPGDDLEPLGLGGGGGASVRLDDGDHDVASLVAEPAALLEHLVRLADARRHAQQHAQPPALHDAPPAREGDPARRGSLSCRRDRRGWGRGGFDGLSHLVGSRLDRNPGP